MGNKNTFQSITLVLLALVVGFLVCERQFVGRFGSGGIATDDNTRVLAEGVDSDLEHAIDIIHATYGNTVSVKEKNKDLFKYGRNQNVSNTEPGSTIMTLIDEAENETYATTTNSIINVSSDSSGDTQNVVIEGQTRSGNNLTFTTQFVQLNGQNTVTLPNPLNRVTRLYTTSTTAFAGNIYVYRAGSTTTGKPDADNEVHLIVRSGRRQSEKASTSISSQDYWILASWSVGVLQKNSAFADCRLEIRGINEGFREVDNLSASDSSGEVIKIFKPYFIVPKNHDVRVVCVGSVDSLDVSANIAGYLAIIQ